jgi:hypothetical protein
MKKTTLFLIAIALSISIFAQNKGVSINETGEEPDKSAILDVQSTEKGILIPRVMLLSNTQPISVSKEEGLMIYNTDESVYKKGIYYWSGSEWKKLIRNMNYQLFSEERVIIVITDGLM